MLPGFTLVNNMSGDINHMKRALSQGALLGVNPQFKTE